MTICFVTAFSYTAFAENDHLKPKSFKLIKTNKVIKASFSKKGEKDKYRFYTGGGMIKIILWDTSGRKFKIDPIVADLYEDGEPFEDYESSNCDFDVDWGDFMSFAPVAGESADYMWTGSMSTTLSIKNSKYRHTKKESLDKYKKGTLVGIIIRQSKKLKGSYKFKIICKNYTPKAAKKTTKKSKKTYTIKFNCNGGKSGGKKVVKRKLKEGSKYGKLPSVSSRTGYTFKGWYTEKKGGSKISKNTKAKKSTTVFARWKPKKYKITYKLNGGTNSTKNKKTFTIETKTFSLYAAKKGGYDFGGWYKDSKLKTRIKKISKGTHVNKTVYARWIKRQIVKDISNVSSSDTGLIFNALSQGSISAEKVSSVWYYKFTKGNNAILVPVSFFYSKSNKDVPSWFNSNATKILNNNQHIYESNFLVSNVYSIQNFAGNRKGLISYTKEISRMKGLFEKSGSSIDVQCETIKTVQFCYYNKKSKTMKAPVTAADYCSLLSRTINYVKLVPKMTIEMRRPDYYSGDLFFTTYTMSGKGLKKSDSISEGIDIAISTGKVVSSLYKLSYSSFFDIYNFVDELKFESDRYSDDGKKNSLSKEDPDDEANSKYCYGFKLKSPIYLRNSGDFVQFNIATSTSDGFNGTDANVEFSIEFPETLVIG